MKSKSTPSLEKVISRLLIMRQAAFTLVVALVLVAASYFGGRYQINRQRQETMLLAQRAADFLDHAERILRAVSQLSLTQNDLNIIQSAYGYFDVLYLLDQQGHLLNISPPNPQFSRGMDMSFQPFYQAGRTRMAVSKPFISARTGNPTVYLSTMTVDGLLVGELSLLDLEGSVMQKDAFQSGAYYVTDQDGYLLAHPQYDLVRQQANIRQLGVIQRANAGQPVQFYFADSGLVIGTVEQVIGSDWLAVIQAPLFAIYGQFFLPAIIGLLVVSILFISLLRQEQKDMASQVVGPLKELSRDVSRLADGDFSSPQNVSSDAAAYAEIASLAGSFERMKEAVQSREESLRESEERLRKITDNMVDLVASYDAQVMLQYASPSYERVLGYLPEELLGTWAPALIHPDEQKEKIDQIGMMLQRGTGSVEFRYRHKDGTYRWFESTGRMMLNDSGEIIGSIMGSRDITERKMAEEEIHKLNAELEERVTARTAELEAAYRELEAYSYSISHDLRAPLRAINGFSRLLLEDYIGQLDGQAQKYLQRVCENSLRMGELIDGLLSFSRLSRQPLARVAVYPAQVARAAMENLSTAYKDRKLEITIEDMPACHAEPAMLMQVYSNLLDNAIKYTRLMESAKIQVGSLTDEGQVVYFVRDNGTGFDMEYAKKLFTVFHRLHRSEDFEGTGVGLAIVKRIVQRHGGKVWADARVNNGATFYFTLGKY